MTFESRILHLGDSVVTTYSLTQETPIVSLQGFEIFIWMDAYGLGKSSQHGLSHDRAVLTSAALLVALLKI